MNIINWRGFKFSNYFVFSCYYGCFSDQKCLEVQANGFTYFQKALLLIIETNIEGPPKRDLFVKIFFDTNKIFKVRIPFKVMKASVL